MTTMAANFYLDSVYDDPSFMSGSNSHSTNDDFLSNALDTYGSLSTSTDSNLPTSSAPTSFPLFDPESPFNSPIVPVKAFGRDGRLKTKLMGVGTDGGFLTSPMLLGNPRMGMQTPKPEIAIASPAPSATHDSEYHAGECVGTHSAQQGSTATTGMGIGITGVSELEGALEMGDYGNPNLKIFGMPKDRQRTTSECGYLPYPEHMPTTTLGRGKGNVVDIAPSPGRGQERHISETARPQTPPLVATSPARTVTPGTAKRPNTNRKNLSVKTISKAKSMSALSQHSQHSQHSSHSYGQEPLTPVSAHSTNFFNIPGVPFNSPDGDNAIVQQDDTVMPFSFADLYNYGLSANSVDEIDPRKSPYQFANDLLKAENGGNRNYNHQNSNGPQNQTYGDDQDANMLNSLPTPFLAHGSGFSSPSTSYLSDPSPELPNMGLAFAQQSPQYSSVPMLPGQLSTASSLSAPSMDQQYSLPLPPHPNSTGGRQRCSSYATRGGNVGNDMLDPALLSPTHSATMQRHVSSPGGFQAPRYSYPTRYAASDATNTVGPYQSWAQQPPPRPNQQQSPYAHPSTMFVPYGESRGPPMTPYERNLETFEDMYDAYSQASTGQSTPGKRGRGSDDEDGQFEDNDGEYVPGGGYGSPQRQPAKRLRTVASAPCLPTASRRMRPGPKPKATKSPQEAHQSVFSATLSPPMAHAFRRASSPYNSDGSPLLESEGEHEGYSSLPKEVIQSLYSSLPSHIGANGQKVAKRYVCLIEGCERTFPRKSAIESHIQTHLEDKPFVCTQPDCDASFVRQHDLRRHERIHSGNKPFPCPCGKGFARGDALARHRARGICSGSLVPRRC